MGKYIFLLRVFSFTLGVQDNIDKNYHGSGSMKTE